MAEQEIKVGQVWKPNVAAGHYTVRKVGAAVARLEYRDSGAIYEPTLAQLRERWTLIKDEQGFTPWINGMRPYGVVRVRLANGQECNGPAERFDWNTHAGESRIVGYKFDEIGAPASPLMSRVAVGQVWRHHRGPRDERPLFTVEVTVIKVEDGQALCEKWDGVRWFIQLGKLVVHYDLVKEAPVDVKGHEPVPIKFVRAASELQRLGYNYVGGAWVSIDGGLSESEFSNNEDAERLKGAHEVIRIWNERAGRIGFDGVSGMLDGMQNDKPPVTGLDVLDATYGKLAAVLNRAHLQASGGKGKERHANGLPFEEQPMASINKALGSVDGFIYQAHKKSLEAKRLPDGRAQAELLGAINYLAGAVIALDSWAKKDAS